MNVTAVFVVETDGNVVVVISFFRKVPYLGLEYIVSFESHIRCRKIPTPKRAL